MKKQIGLGYCVLCQWLVDVNINHDSRGYLYQYAAVNWNRTLETIRKKYCTSVFGLLFFAKAEALMVVKWNSKLETDIKLSPL